MKIEPVLEASPPKYPGKNDKEIQRVIEAAQPLRWRSKPAICALSAALALSTSVCVSGCYETYGVPVQSPSIQDEMLNVWSCYSAIENPLLLSTMIPLFEYGNGRADLVGIPGAPATPIIMSEEEAFYIISKVFEEVGVTLNRGTGVLYDINIPTSNIANIHSMDGAATMQKVFSPDGLLGAHNMPVIFVSPGKLDEWAEWIEAYAAENDYAMVHVIDAAYDLRRTARTITEDNPGLVVFYDPITHSNIEFRRTTLEQGLFESDDSYNARKAALENEMAQAARAESERLLRMQVEAFIEWLENEGF